MKNQKNNIFVLLFALVIMVSCSEDVNIKSEFEEEYLLNCVLSLDTTYQVAYLSKSFDIDGFDIDSYEGDPFVKNANLVLRDGNNTYIFREAQIDSLEGFNIGRPITYYYLDNYQPYGNRTVTIGATLPDGNRVIATQQTVTRKLSYLPIFRRSIPPVDTTDKNIEFRVYDEFEGDYFVPKLEVIYEHPLSSGNYFSTEVPINYVEKSGSLQPIYPNVYRLIDFAYDRDVMGITMRKISEGDPAKGNYKVITGMMTMLVLNEDLAAYYSASSFINDNYSITVSQPDYSNVEGGGGIFGSFSKISGKIKISKNYISSFGYRN